MGSSSDTNTERIDASVGSLVWVRRRNGSWWPGRIMGLDEVSESCLASVSPRSGTPVKLLGRDDASIDWYNLEKSKRIKPFRCGDYDECIEKAKASVANSGKKTVKYARREDAILHALELESSLLSSDGLVSSCKMDTSGSEHGSLVRQLPPTMDSNEVQEMADDLIHSEESSDSARELSQSGISFEEPNHLNSPKAPSGQGRKRRTPNDSEDDGMERVKRMRGLKDLEMNVVSKRKSEARGILELARQESTSLLDSNTGNCMSNGCPVNGIKVYSSSLKRKRSQVPNVHEFLKRKNRRRPLTKLLESTAMVSVPTICDKLPNSGIESYELKKSLTINSDSTGVSFENGVSVNASEDSIVNFKVKENEISIISGLPESDSSERLFDGLFVVEENHSAGITHNATSGRQSDQSSQAEPVYSRSEGLNESGSTSSEAVHGDNNVSRWIEKDTSEWQIKGKRNSRHASKDRKQESRKYANKYDVTNTYLTVTDHLGTPSHGGSPSDDCIPRVNPKKTVEDVREQTELTQLSDDSLMSQKLLPYRQSRYTVHPRSQIQELTVGGFRTKASLYDVKLDVKASYRPQHVPLVSLMSKLNGKAIVGHPLTIDIIDEGQFDSLSSRIRSEENGRAVGRNLVIRTPSKHLASQPKKSRKRKKSGQLSKKTRKLSSLTGHKQTQGAREAVVEKRKGHVISCIPLKVVFSRINEAVNGLKRPAHHPVKSGK